MSDFTAGPFNVEQQLWESYGRFIEELRNLVAVRYSHNRAVLPLEANPPTRFFDIVLQTNNYNIRLRLRRDNLYLVGYQMHNSNQWLELRHDHNSPQHRIANSTYLNFDESYDGLIATANQQNISGIEAGRLELINAINLLATTGNNARRARSLIVVIVMISESIRFVRITNHFLGVGRTTLPIPSWILDYAHGWNDLSGALLHNDVDNNFQFPEFNDFGTISSPGPRVSDTQNGDEINNYWAAAAIIGTLKGHFFPPVRYGRPRRAADDGGSINAHYPAGRPLVEIFSVTINNINGNQRIIGNIYGTIQVHDGLGYEYVYKREMNCSESIRASETVLLNGPSRCITAYNRFTISVSLLSKEGLGEDNEISKGKILWEVTNINTNEYDKLLLQQFRGRFGSATMSYAVLSDAVKAMVEVTLFKNGDSADIYGLLTSHNVNLNIESVLFHKANNKFINVKPGRLVPLSRSVVAVPFNSDFIVQADLKGSNNLSYDEEIAKGIATFVPQLSGTQEQYIYGKNNSRIRVKVTWAWYV